MSNTRPEQGRLLAAIGPGAYAALMALWAQVSTVTADEVRAIRRAYVLSRYRGLGEEGAAMADNVMNGPIGLDAVSAEVPEQWRMAGMLAPICSDDAPEVIIGLAVRLESSYGRAMWQRIQPIPESRIGEAFDPRNPPP